MAECPTAECTRCDGEPDPFGRCKECKHAEWHYVCRCGGRVSRLEEALRRVLADKGADYMSQGVYAQASTALSGEND